VQIVSRGTITHAGSIRTSQCAFGFRNHERGAAYSFWTNSVVAYLKVKIPDAYQPDGAG
jgi:hypothetical protein